MSTKELYEAHALIATKKATEYNLVDEAIKKYIEAEQYLRIHLKGTFTRATGDAPEEKDIKQMYAERFKVVICGLAVCKGIAAIPDGPELKQLQFLAKAVECPKAVWQ